MPIQFMIRKYKNFVPFRNAIENLILMEGNHLILSTGYIVNLENEKKDESGIFIKELSEVIVNALKEKDLCMTIVGERNKDDIKLFVDFCELIECYVKSYSMNNKINKFQIVYKDVAFNNWHGKVAIKYYKDNSVLKIMGAVIGSSNFTLPSLVPNRYPWNREADLYIVDGNLVKDRMLGKEKYSRVYCVNEVANLHQRLKELIMQLRHKGITYDVPQQFLYPDENTYWDTVKDATQRCMKEYKALSDLKGWQRYDILQIYHEIFDIFSELRSLKRIENTLIDVMKNEKQAIENIIAYLENMIIKYDEDYFLVQLKEKMETLNSKLNYMYMSSSYDDIININNGIKDSITDTMSYTGDLLCKDLNEKIYLYTDDYSGLDDLMEEMQEVLNNSSKMILSLFSIVELEVKGNCIEPLLMGIYTEMRDIIDYFTIQEYPKNM